jgi:hypothetical protein
LAATASIQGVGCSFEAALWTVEAETATEVAVMVDVVTPRDKEGVANLWTQPEGKWNLVSTSAARYGEVEVAGAKIPR